MTDAELNEAVAREVMGWVAEQIVGGDTKPQWRYAPRDWNPANSIADAMQVVEAMNQQSMLVAIGQHLESGYGVSFYSEADEYKGGADGPLSRAICEAALEAVRQSQGSSQPLRK